MEFTIKLSPDQVRVVLAGLDELKHSVSRPTFDVVYQQIQQQELAFRESAPPAPGLSD